MKMQLWTKVSFDNHGHRAKLAAHALTTTRKAHRSAFNY